MQNFFTALFFLVGGFIVFPQQERASNIVQLQYMCGIRAYLYWLSTYLFDLTIYTIVTAVILVAIFLCELVMSEKIFTGFYETTALFTIIIAFAIPGILYCYLFSYKNSSAGAFTAFLMVSLFTGMMVTLVVQALILSGDAYYENLGQNLRHILLLLPPFGVSYTVLNFARKAAKNYQFGAMSDNEKIVTCRFDYNPCCDGMFYVLPLLPLVFHNYFLTGGSAACTQYKSYFFGNDLAVGNDLLIIVFSSSLYLLLLLFVESVRWQRYWEKINTIYYKISDRNNSYNIEHSVLENVSSRELG